MSNAADDTAEAKAELLRDHAQRLATLRFLLEDAIRRSSDSSEIGRHAAVQLLQNSCEQGLIICLSGLALDHTEKDRIEDMWAKMCDALPPGPWKQRAGFQEIRNLNTSRNQSHHKGIVPDHAQLVGWAGRAQRFLEIIVTTVFDTSLMTHASAGAIRSQALRELVAAAEEHTARKQYREAIDALAEALTRATAAWRRQRRDMRVHDGLSHLDTKDMDRNVATELHRLVELNEIEPFALDLGTYLWVRDTIRAAQDDSEMRHIVRFDRTDVAQVMSFVFNWIVRWESFTATADTGRWERWRTELLSPSTSEPHLGCRLVSGPIDVVAKKPLPFDNVAPDSAAVHLQLADLPDIDEAKFLTYMNALLTKEFAHRTESARIVAGGRVEVRPVGADTAVDEVVAAVNRATAGIPGVLARQAELDEAWARDHEADVAPLREALSNFAIQGETVFSRIAAAGRPPALRPGGDSRRFEVVAEFTPRFDELARMPDFTNAFNNRRAIVNNIRSPYSGREGSAVFIVPGADPAEVETAVNTAFNAVVVGIEAANSAAEKYDHLIQLLTSRFESAVTNSQLPANRD